MLSTLSIFEKKKNLGKKQSFPYPQQAFTRYWEHGHTTTDLPFDRRDGEETPALDSRQAPDVDFLPTETLPSCLFPPLLWRRHLLHGASNHLRLCSLREKERNTWRRKVWESSNQQTGYHSSPWSSMGELTAATSHRWLPSGRTDPASLQHQYDSCEKLW